MKTNNTKKGGCKVYGYHESTEAVHAALMETPVGNRHAYEIITADTPCHPYLDIEFLVPHEDGRHETNPDHGKLIMILKKVRENFKEAYGVEAQFVVLISSRYSTGDDMFKYSYHATIVNIVMANNHNGLMLRLLQVGMEDDHDAKAVSPYYWFHERKSEYKHIVDYLVYGKNRVMRMMGCSKRGSAVPLIKLVDERYAEYFDGSPVVDAMNPTLQELSQSLINQPNAPITPFLPSFQCCDIMVAAKTERHERPYVAKPVTMDARDPNYPFSHDELKEILLKHGDATSRIGDCTQIGATKFKVYCHTCGNRYCLHSPETKQHDGNNFVIILSATGNGKWFACDYFCYGCGTAKGEFFLGKIKRLQSDSVAMSAVIPPLAVSKQFAARHENDLIVYCNPLVEPIPLTHRLVALCSPCGTGKTKEIRRFLPEYSEKNKLGLRIIAAFHRQTMSMTSKKTYPAINGVEMTHYHEIDGEIDIDEVSGLIIQVEALARISNESLMRKNTKTVVILDEFCSIIKQLQSGVGNVARTSAVFNYLLQHADLVIAMDGYFDQARLDIFESYGKEAALLILNTYKSRGDHQFELSRSAKHTLEWQLESMARGENHMCPCCEKSQAMIIVAAIKARFGDEKKVKLYTKEDPYLGEDIDEEWIEYHCVVFTPTIDTGSSCELVKHFQYCTGYASPNGGSTFEAFSQMISRARDIKNFVIACTTSSERFLSCSLQAIVTEKAAVIQNCDAVFFGTQNLASTTHSSTTWANCTPNAKTYVMSIALDRRTRKGMVNELIYNIQRDGGTLKTLEKFNLESEVKKLKTEDGDKPPKTISEADLTLIHKHYDFDFSRISDAKKLMHYAKPHTLAAHHNLETLALYMSFEDAMLRARQDTQRLATGLDLLDKAHKGELRNATDGCRQYGGVLPCSNYFLEANEKGSEICKIITGEGDIFNIPPQTETEIALRLDCSEQPLVDKDGEIGKEICVSQALKTVIITKYKAWIDIEPKLHRTFSFPLLAKPLPLIKVMKILNDVLGVLIGASYTSERKQEQFQKFTVYTFHESAYFRRQTSYYSEDYGDDNASNLPLVKAWAKKPLPALAEGNLIEYEDGIAQPGAEYKRRQGNTGFHKPMKQIQRSDVEPGAASKRRRFGS